MEINRLIDKDAEIRRVMQYCAARACEHKYYSVYCKACDIADCIDEFENAEEVDAIPVRHVQMQYNGLYHYCPDCCTMVFDPISDQFCRRCGAMFGGGAENERSN